MVIVTTYVYRHFDELKTKEVTTNEITTDSIINST